MIAVQMLMFVMCSVRNLHHFGSITTIVHWQDVITF